MADIQILFGNPIGGKDMKKKKTIKKKMVKKLKNPRRIVVTDAKGKVTKYPSHRTAQEMQRLSKDFSKFKGNAKEAEKNLKSIKSKRSELKASGKPSSAAETAAVFQELENLKIMKSARMKLGKGYKKEKGLVRQELSRLKKLRKKGKAKVEVVDVSESEHLAEFPKNKVKKIKTGGTMAKRKKKAAKKAAKRKVSRKSSRKSVKRSRKSRKSSKKSFLSLKKAKSALAKATKRKGGVGRKGRKFKMKRAKRKYSVAVRRSKNPINMMMVKSYLKHDIAEAGGLLLGGASHSLVNDLAVKYIPGLSGQISKIFGRFSGSVIPMGFGVLLGVLNEKFMKKNAYVDSVAKGLIGSGVVGLGATAYEMAKPMIPGMAGLAYSYPNLSGEYNQMGANEYLIEGEYNQMGALEDIGFDEIGPTTEETPDGFGLESVGFGGSYDQLG